MQGVSEFAGDCEEEGVVSVKLLCFNEMIKEELVMENYLFLLNCQN